MNPTCIVCTDTLCKDFFPPLLLNQVCFCQLLRCLWVPAAEELICHFPQESQRARHQDIWGMIQVRVERLDRRASGSASRITEQLRLKGACGNCLCWPPLRAGPANASCSGPCTVRFWVSPRVETPQPVCVITLPIKKVSVIFSVCLLLMLKWYFLYFHLYHSPLVWKDASVVPFSWVPPSLIPFSLVTPSGIYTWIRSSQHILFSKLNSASSLSLYLYVRCSHPSIFMACSTRCLSLLHWVRSPGLDPELQMFTGAEQMGTVTSLNLRAALFVMQPRGLLASSWDIAVDKGRGQLPARL